MTDPTCDRLPPLDGEDRDPEARERAEIVKADDEEDDGSDLGDRWEMAS